MTDRRHWWQGEWIDDEELATRIRNLEEYVDAPLRRAFPLETLLATAEAFSRRLFEEEELRSELADLVCSAGKTGGADIETVLNTIGTLMRREELEAKLSRELGTRTPFLPERVSFERNDYERWAPLGLLLHITPGNVFSVGVLSLLEGLLTGNVNVVKASRADAGFSQHFAELFFSMDETGALKDYAVVAALSSRETELLDELYRECDGVSVWGSEETIRAVKEAVPFSCRVVEWGHKISFAYVSSSCLEDREAMREIALDCCRLEQQACSSPQTVFVEASDAGELLEYAEAFGEVLGDVSPTVSGFPPGLQERAEITTRTELCRLEGCVGEEKTAGVVEAPDGRWRLLVNADPGLRPSPLFRTVWVTRMDRIRVQETLHPLRTYLQTAGLVCARDELDEISSLLVASGVLRVTPPGRMLDSYSGAPHDGVYALARYARRISIETDDRFRGYGLLSEFRTPEPPPGLADAPVLTKKAFQAREVDEAFAHLHFRSGGTTGKPVMSVYTYDDYHAQMRAAAYGLYAAGLEPTKDRAINLFAAGNLYGGFLSFFTIMEDLGVRQFPMALVEDRRSVAEAIVHFGIDTLVGVPAYILQLLRENETLMRDYGGLRKLFYGGEHVGPSQEEYLRSFGIELIRSAAYGSNDAGPLGYQCPECTGGEHHLLSQVQHLEIFKMDEDEPVEGTEPGRLLFTSRSRQGQEIVRYEIGDVGHWVEDPCPCGRKDPKFVLAGRLGDVFKAGGPFLNYQVFGRLLREGFGYEGNVQILLETSGAFNRMTLRVEEGGPSPESVRAYLAEHYPELALCLEELNLEFHVEPVEESGFETTPATGKLRRIIDRRQEG